MPRAGDGGLSGIVPARPSKRFRRFFAGYAGRLLRRRFHAARILADDVPVLEALDQGDEPAIILLTHASWWDPLVGLVLWRRFGSSRELMMPMDADQLARFDFFRRLGMFGIDPDDPRSLEEMRSYILERFENDEERCVLGLTPQGRFTDPREPVRIRPGAAAIAAACSRPPKVMAVAVEYPFWQDQRPELLVAASDIEVPATTTPTTADWHRAMTAGMTDAVGRLAAASIDRDASVFRPLDRRLDPRTRINPVMDLWMRLRGRAGEIDARRSKEASA